MSDSTVPSSHYISTVKALVKMIEQNDELRGELRDYEDAFEQLTKDVHNAENAASWLSVEPREDFDSEEFLKAIERAAKASAATAGNYAEQPIGKPLSYYEAQVVHHHLKLDEALRVVRNFKQPAAVSDKHVSEEEADDILERLTDVDSPVPYTITEPAPDFSNTTENEPLTYSLAEAAAILGRQGIDTGQNKLKKFLNTGICWTDAFGTPRGIAGDYLVETEPANPSRDAVVRITPEGVNELERVLNVAV